MQIDVSFGAWGQCQSNEKLMQTATQSSIPNPFEPWVEVYEVNRNELVTRSIETI